jgi:hypothetical protein
MALFAEFRSKGKEQEWSLMAMHILLSNMPSQERELWHKEGTQGRVEMEFWPLELYKFVTRRWEDFEDARRSKRKRVKHKKRRRYSRNSKPLCPAAAAVSAALQGSVSMDKPESGVTNEGVCKQHCTDELGQDGHESDDAAYDCKSEDSNNPSESRDEKGLVSGSCYNEITSHHDWESSHGESAGERESGEDSSDCSGSSSEYETDSLYSDESADLPVESSRRNQNNEPEMDIIYQEVYRNGREPEGGGDCKLSHKSVNDSVREEEEDVRPGEPSGPSPDCEPKEAVSITATLKVVASPREAVTAS